MKEKENKVKKKFNWRKFWAITSTVMVFIIIITVIMVTGTDISIKVADRYGIVKETTYAIEKTDYGFKIINDKDNFRILQLTDIHIGGGILSIRNDKMALTAVAAIVEEVNPDLIIVTGDIAYPIPFQSGTINNLLAAKIFARLMDNLGIPWTITFGNHDTESYSLYDRSELTKFYSEQKHCLLTRGPEDITGYGNQIITLYNQDGGFNTAIVQIDSNDYIKGEAGFNKYDIIHDDQLEWYKNSILELSEGRESVVPSMMFIHIPFAQYRTAYELYEQGGEGITYFYGQKRERVATSELECNTFKTIKELGSTKAVFCGHDHVNDYSIEYEGVRLTYGKSIDYLAYAWSGIIKQTEQRGGTIIDINSDSSFEISTIKYVDIQNK